MATGAAGGAAADILHRFGSWECSHLLIERETGKQVEEQMPPLKALRMWALYQTLPGRLLLALPPTWWVLGWQHRRLAAYANSLRSKKAIPGLIKDYAIDVSTAEKPPEAYGTLQEFFARRLRPELRPIAEPNNDAVAVMPGDSRVVVFDDVVDAHRFWIKGRAFSVRRLLGLRHDQAAPEWDNCAIAINRLAPVDCHRLHAAVSGRVSRFATHGHRFLGSEWAATHSSVNPMTENERLVMEFESDTFGPVIQVMIGAAEVGSVQPLVGEGQVVRKGDEVAVFGYGGSIMTTLFSHP
ncbi:hypothetical protein HXX76_013514 [Chlamydomonas incerta]|uniref:Phosphatidylserine decarboxylase n=1 Tax=Chlamydomonas incerta TaxID=51695 RepID=A0A835SIQ3_CHLIN|nr:hypothetical protein HXX76_013514 [Chlamydomonas incerta]|eukprot:KAG2425672.1 hypothetical protein HXX76_013514 [Chlamydomonas incerta]